MGRFLLFFGVVMFTASVVAADEIPARYKDTYPEYAIESALEARKTLEGKDAELDPKTRQLISLAVAAQIPCDYCVFAAQKGARANGATEGEIREAVATAATIRQWSTVLNGMAYDFEAFKSEVSEK